MNKKDKIERCRHILYKYNVGDTITDINDGYFLLSIFKNHSEWETKKGVGISTISVINNFFKTRCFQLNRIDGTSTDISFTHSISNVSKISEIKKACRTAIRDEIVKFRNANVEFGKTTCAFTNEILTSENTHIDHYDLSFDEMFNIWSSTQNLDYLHSKINETEDNSFTTYFTDSSIINDFVKFHNENCKLRAVSKTANLSILKTLNNNE